MQVHINTHEHDVLATWGELERTGIHTYFQTRTWCLSWLRDVGPVLGVGAVFVTALREDGRPAFMLPLQVRRKFGFSLLEFLTGPHASYGFGLYDKAFLETEAAEWFSAHFSSLLSLLPKHDAVYLREIPCRMLGYANPLSPFARMAGANHAYMMTLDGNFERLLSEKRSAETLKNIRKRDKRLSEMGEVKFGVPANSIERKMILERMFTDHEQRLAQAGIRGVYGPIERQFLCGLADPDQQGALALTPYTLSINGEPICVLLGGKSCNVFWAMMTSLADGPWRKHSPGDYTLRHVIAAQCSDGLAWFDFAVGDSEYKLAWADTIIDLHLVLQASSVKGLVLTLGLALKHGTKRVFKNNAVLREGAFALRKLAFGRRVN